MSRPPLQYEEGLEIIQKGLEGLKRKLKEEFFDSARYVQIYTNYSDHEIGFFITYFKIFLNYMTSVVWPCLKEKHGKDLLVEFVVSWRKTEDIIFSFSHHFARFYRCHGFDVLGPVGYWCFKSWVYKKLRKRVRNVLIHMVDEERDGKKIERCLWTYVVGVLLEIGEKDYLEMHLKEKTIAYYSRCASKWILECSCSEYMRIVEGCLKNEQERASQYLYLVVENVTGVVEHELLVVHQKQLLEKEGSGFRSLLAAGSFKELSRIFQIYKKLPGCLEPVVDIFGDYVREEGITVVQQAEEAAMANAGVVQEQILVRKLIGLLDKFNGYVSACFEDHSLFCKVKNEVFEEFGNKIIAETSMVEIFATFFDNTLRKKKRKRIDESTEQMLVKAVRFLHYVNEKDFFSEIYRRKMGRGLLNFDQNPINVLQNLKQQPFSGQFKSAMEGMVNDLILAEKDHYSFMECIKDIPDLEPGFDFSVTVLTNEFWPRYMSSLDMNLPLEMSRCLQSYTIFYNSTTRYKKLTWIYSLGQCRLLGSFDRNTIELIVSTHQAAVLLLFNSSDQLSFSDMASQLNLSPEDLCPLLHSLCLDKYKILTKNPDTNVISQSDTFEFNAKFVERTRKIHVPYPVVIDKREHERVVEDVKRDRRYAIDAAIVRIMKNRKVAELEELVSECIDQLKHRFKPDANVIEIRVENLITRDFLERDPTSPSTLSYLA